MRLAKTFIIITIFVAWIIPGNAQSNGSVFTKKSSTIKLLHTIEEGAWECKYYFLNYNSDLNEAEKARWFSISEDEDDWITGQGPFSNDKNQFLTTEWPSVNRPILVRRHFRLDSEIEERLEESILILECSYDENPKVYLNGIMVWETEGWNDNSYETVKLDYAASDLLKEGDNILAVSLPAGEGGGHIDIGLSLEFSDSENSILGLYQDEKELDFYNLNGVWVGKRWKDLPKGIFITKGKKFISK